MTQTIVRMPQLGESVAEGTIGRWLKKPGDRVERDEPLVEIQTDKVNAEVPSPVAGIVQELLLPEGATVAVKTDIAVIGDGEAPTAPDAPAAPAAQSGGSRGAQHPVVAEDGPAPGASERPRVAEGGPAPRASERPAAPEEAQAKRFYTPVVLRMAEEHGLDLSTIQGTGTNGRVTRRDVERALTGQAPPVVAPEVPPATPEAPPVVPAAEPEAQPTPTVTVAAAEPAPALAAGRDERSLTPMRRAIAEHMTRARAEIPDAWSMIEVDVTHVARQRDQLQAEWQAREGFELTYLPFFVKAVLAGLRAVPELNASWAGDKIVVHRQYQLGIAVSVENGLVVPVLRDADQLSLAGLARQLRQLIQKARGGKLTLDDLQGVTFHVNNPGALGSIMSQPIVPVGAAGIVTMEAVVKRPVVTADDAIAVRSMMNCCLSFDHRVLDGAQALRFLRTLKNQLETVDYALY